MQARLALVALLSLLGCASPTMPAVDASADATAVRDAITSIDAVTPDALTPDALAPVDAAPVEDRAIPPAPDAGPLSCGAAGGNTCLPAGPGVCDGEERFTSSDCATCCRRCDRRTTIDVARPTIFYYGMVPDAAGGPDDALTQRLLIPGVEVIFGLSNPPLFDPPGWTAETNGAYPTCAPQTAAFTTWHARGAKLARLISNDTLQAWLTDGTAADRVERILRYGWDYVAIDEIGGLAWRDDAAERYAQRSITLLEELARRGFDRRMFFWLNPASTEIWRDPATGNGVFPLMQRFLTACMNHCRRFIIESYPQNAAACGEPTTPWTRCVTSRTVVGSEDTERYFEWAATRMGLSVPMINNQVLTGIGLGNNRNASGIVVYQDQPACDIAPYRGACPASPTRGSLVQQFAALHGGARTNNQRGVAFYGLTHVRESSGSSVWTKADLVEHLRNLTSWWSGM